MVNFKAQISNINEPNRVGYIYCNGIFTGILSEYKTLKEERYVFKYAETYLESGCAIGHRFPLTGKPFEFDIFPTFFANMVSEGWLRTHQAKHGRLDKSDSFGLLLANGEELIGAISVLPHRIEHE